MLCFHCVRQSSIPGRGTKIPQAVRCKAKKKKKKKRETSACLLLHSCPRIMSKLLGITLPVPSYLRLSSPLPTTPLCPGQPESLSGIPQIPQCFTLPFTTLTPLYSWATLPRPSSSSSHFFTLPLGLGLDATSSRKTSFPDTHPIPTQNRLCAFLSVS